MPNCADNDLIAAILPLKISGGYQDDDLERARMLLNSLHCKWRGTNPLNITIASPSGCLDRISNEFIGRSRNLNIKIVDELEVCPELINAPEGQFWYKQQIIKLAIHKLIKTKYYLTLDADIILFKPLIPDLVYVDGRVLTGWENRSLHAEWWSVSANHLGYKGNPLLGYGMHPTPQFLSTTAVKDLCIYLNTRYSGDAWTFLLHNRGWTEYTLYNLYLEMTQKVHQYHHSLEFALSNKTALKSWRGFSTLEQYDAWDPYPAFSPTEPGYFAVLNSSSKINPALIHDKIRRFYPESVF